MGKIVIISPGDHVPNTFDSHVRNNIVDLKELGGNVGETSAEFFRSVLQIGGNTATGKTILGAICNPQQPLDIPIAPILSQTYGTGFDPDVPGVVYNFGCGGFFPSAEPKPVRATIILFHELGHVVQWILKRQWFQQQAAVRSKTGFNEAIERDNLVTHEWPMCKELGHPMRMNYLDMFNTAEEAKQRFEETTKAATVMQSAIRGFLARQKLGV